VAGELRFAIARAKIVQVAGGKVTASYEVLTPGNVTVPSDKLHLTVKTGSGSIGLPPAIVEGVSADNTLDPADVGDTIVVHVPANASFLPGDTIQVVWQGVGVGGSFTTPAQAANTAGVRFEVDTSVLPPNAGQRVTVYYLLIRPGVEPDQDSDKRYITVLEDSSEGDLPVPTVTQASVDGKLDPFAVPAAGAEVVVPARADLVTGDTVTVTFGNYTSAPPQAAQPGMTFRVPPGEIAKHLSQTVRVLYTRWRAGMPTDSEVLTLQVGHIANDDARVVKPVFAEANGSAVLDLNTFTGDATIKITAWPLMAAGQTFAVNVGTWEVARTTVVTTVGDFTLRLDRKLLDTLADASRLTIALYVGYDGDIPRTLFSSLFYTVRVATADFDIDTSLLALTGTQTATRNATGGKPPYRYVSSKPNVVRVPDASLGGIQAVADGSANITASDQGGGSKSYPVTVIDNAPPLAIDQTPMALTGVIYRTDNPVTNPPPGAYGMRQASGGRPPYKYHAENPIIVDVDPVSGRVVSRTSGTTRVFATDSANQQVAYSVSASNIQKVFGTGVFGTYTQCRQGAEAGGGRLLTRSEWTSVRTSHNSVTGCGNQVAWTNDQTHVGKRWAVQPDSGITSELIDFGIGGQTAVGWGLRAG
jgi:hypothetical protein